MTSRDRRYEAAFLAVAARAHGQAGAGWARHAAVRLEAGEDAYGERWTTLGTEALLDELAEGAADLGAWGALARQALDLEPVDAVDRPPGRRGPRPCRRGGHRRLRRPARRPPGARPGPDSARFRPVLGARAGDARRWGSKGFREVSGARRRASMSRACDVCGASLDGRRPDARYCSPGCRREAAREREEAAWRTENAEQDGSTATVDDCRAHACEARLARLEQRLDEHGPRLLSVDGRLLARIIRDALRGEPER